MKILKTAGDSGVVSFVQLENSTTQKVQWGNYELGIHGYAGKFLFQHAKEVGHNMQQVGQSQQYEWVQQYDVVVSHSVHQTCLEENWMASGHSSGTQILVDDFLILYINRDGKNMIFLESRKIARKCQNCKKLYARKKLYIKNYKKYAHKLTIQHFNNKIIN